MPLLLKFDSVKSQQLYLVYFLLVYYLIVGIMVLSNLSEGLLSLVLESLLSEVRVLYLFILFIVAEGSMSSYFLLIKLYSLSLIDGFDRLDCNQHGINIFILFYFGSLSISPNLQLSIFICFLLETGSFDMLFAFSRTVFLCC